MAETIPSLAAPPLDLLAGAALFLDFDGTLVPITDRPQDVVVDDALPAMLLRLRDALDGRLAIVSGRPISVLRDTFGLGNLILSGSHGLEFAYPLTAPVAPPRLKSVDAAQAALMAFVADKPGLLVEEKSLGVGLHFRLAPQWEAACLSLVQELAAELGLFVQHGKMLAELRPGGADKGSAIEHLMTQEPLKQGIPVFIGDDVTDEDGFEAARRAGGFGILVGARRPTAAAWRLEQVDDVVRYLSVACQRA